MGFVEWPWIPHDPGHTVAALSFLAALNSVLIAFPVLHMYVGNQVVLILVHCHIVIVQVGVAMDMAVSLVVTQSHTSVLHVVVSLERVLYSHTAGAADTGLNLMTLYLPFDLLGQGEVLEYYYIVHCNVAGYVLLYYSGIVP